MHIHGRYDRPRRGGKRLTVRADESKIIRREDPAWRIVPAPLWAKVEERFARQAEHVAAKGNPWGAGHPKHPLSGLGRCAECGGPITVATTKRGKRSIQAYSCAYAKKRGAAVCTVSIRQPRDVVEGALVRHLLDHVLTPSVVEAIIARVEELAYLDQRNEAVPAERLEEELATQRKEQQRCARLLAKLEDAGELEALYADRTARIRELERAIAAAKAAPTTAVVALDTLADEIAATFERLRQGLVGAEDEARQAMLALFDRLLFTPYDDRKHWEISGRPRIQAPTSPAFATPAGFEPASSA